MASARLRASRSAPSRRRPLLVPDAAQALIGSRLDDDALAKAAQAASAAARPIDDKRGTVDYRRAMVGVLTKRAAASALPRVRRGN